MSKTIKFTVSDENYEFICNAATNERLSLQDYIRNQLFPGQISFTPLDAINRALTNYSPGEPFTVPELFGDDWNLPNGTAGQFGRKFYNLVTKEYSSKIHFTGNFNSKKHAIYEIV